MCGTMSDFASMRAKDSCNYDPLPDIPVPIFAFRLRTLVHIERECGAAF
jgi:hypothetical protein